MSRATPGSLDRDPTGTVTAGADAVAIRHSRRSRWPGRRGLVHNRVFGLIFPVKSMGVNNETGKPSRSRRRAPGTDTVSTLADVARLAGVSTASVSRVLNKRESVGADVRVRVEAAIRSLRFVPNAAARALRSTKTRLVGAIIPTLNYAIYARMVESLQERLTSSSVSLIIKTSGYDLQKEREQVSLLIEHGVDCVVVVGDAQREQTLQLLAEHGVPVVLTYANAADSDLPSVGFVNLDAAAAVAEHLHELGHRRYAMISGVSRHNDRVRDRITGFVSGLGRLGVPSRDIRIIEVEYRMAAGYAAMSELLQDRDSFTAVFCGSDVLAVGALKACADAGVDCPREVSIVGFDNLEIGEYSEPALTTVEVSGSKMGTQAAEIVISVLSGRVPSEHVCLEAPLIVRRSTARARN